jgi:hypothetical protein
MDGKDRLMGFISSALPGLPSGQPAAVYHSPLNSINVACAAGSGCVLDKARGEIEVFFKQVKLTRRLSGFMGYIANASAGRSGPPCFSRCCCALPPT